MLYFLHCNYVSCHSHVNFLPHLFICAQDIFEGFRHLFVKVLIYFVLTPEIAIPILHPFKYETVTPPELQRKSGITNTPFSASILSASGVVGPFASSATSFAFTLSALSFLSWFSMAAGMSMSTSS